MIRQLIKHFKKSNEVPAIEDKKDKAVALSLLLPEIDLKEYK